MVYFLQTYNGACKFLHCNNSEYAALLYCHIGVTSTVSLPLPSTPPTIEVGGRVDTNVIIPGEKSNLWSTANGMTVIYFVYFFFSPVVVVVCALIVVLVLITIVGLCICIRQRQQPKSKSETLY